MRQGSADVQAAGLACALDLRCLCECTRPVPRCPLGKEGDRRFTRVMLDPGERLRASSRPFVCF